MTDVVRRQITSRDIFLGEINWNIVVCDFVDVKRGRGRQGATLLTYLGKITQKPPKELLRLFKLRIELNSCVHSIRRLRI